MTTYTVIGYWDGDCAIPVGVVEGRHSVTGGYGCSEGGPWATSAEASDSVEAERLAVAEMEEPYRDDEHAPDCVQCEHDCTRAKGSLCATTRARYIALGAPSCAICDDHEEATHEGYGNSPCGCGNHDDESETGQ